jgi:iron complex outermembrane recepter protein
MSNNRNSFICRTSLLSATGIFIALSAPAFAQDSGQNSAQEIIVTAQRRSEALEAVPLTVTVATQETLQKAGISGIHDLDQITPGVQISFTGSLTQPAIRGVSTLTAGEGFENNVAVYIDGFYQPNTAALNMSLSNVASVEIYKGPQGTLYGRNATGGAISLTTLAPSDHLTGSAEASYRRYDDIRFSGYVSGPLSDRVRVSLTGYFRNSDGYYKSIDPAGSGKTVGNAAPVRQRLIQGKIEVDLTERLTATLAHTTMTNDDPTTLLFPNQGYAPSFLADEPFAARLPFRASPNVETSNRTTSHDTTLKVVLDTEFGSITSRTGYVSRRDHTVYDFDGTYDEILEAFGRFKQTTFQQMLDYSIDNIDRLKVTFGASYYKDIVKNDGSQNFFQGGLLDTQYVRLSTEAFTVYADATYEVADKLFINLGGRYTDEKKTDDYADLFQTGPFYLVEPGSTRASFSNFSPRGTIRYEVGPRTNVYASISRGWRSGGFNPTPPPGDPFKDEKITAYEVGFKTAQSSFRFNVSGFYYDYKDLQVGVTQVNPINNSLISFVSNAPTAEIYGLDVDGSISPVEGLTINAGFALLHARYKRFPGVTGIGLDPATNLDVQQIQDWSGLQMVRAPEFSGNIGFNYETDLAGGRIQVSGNVFHTASYAQSNPSVFGPLAGALANKQRYTVGPYQLVNGQIGWTEPSGHATVSVFVTNLTNERYYINYGGTSFFGDVGVFNQPRSVGVKLKVNY